MKQLLLVLILLFMAFAAAAQTVTTDDPTAETELSSSVNIFVVICDNRAIVNLDGTMEAGLDVYYQVFNGAQGSTGQAITALRRVSVDGAYAVSETATYNEGTTIAAGSIGSVYVAIASESASDRTTFSTFVDDLQDGCADPLNTTTTSTAVDGTVPVSGTPGVPGTTTTSATTQILSPFGGVVNPGYVPPAKPANLVGPREQFTLPRQQTPGLIFAECEDFDVAEPGIVYDTDNVIVFWSWFADTAEQAQAHIDNANYSVTYYQTLPLPNPIRTEIREINGLFWVFYYSVLGNLLPGQYYIEYKVNWDNAITDGFEDFGPGTARPEIISGCGFDVQTNPQNTPVSFNSWPYRLLNP
ncbi:MAG: hypothetical protein OHK0046_14490 [Anaerolineae bacterium]